MRTPALLALCLCAALAACSRPAAESGAASAAKSMPAADKAGRAATLAYVRAVEVETAADKVAQVFASTQSACAAATADACVVLDARLSTGTEPDAKLVLRAAPAGVRRLLDGLRSGGGVVSESASAEDLAAPIADGERRIAMLRDYRDSLVALRARGGNDIGALMKVNQELAEVQSQLESAAGDEARLHLRVATETLTVTIHAIRESAVLAPIAQAARGFAGHLADAVAATITFVAYAVPWGLLLFALGWALRKLWLRLRRMR
jgi:hypothetical protein